MPGSLDEHLRWILAAPIYAVAYAVGAAIFWWMAERRSFLRDERMRLLIAGLMGGLAGANLVQLVATSLPGKTIEGGIIGGWIAVILAKRQLAIRRPTGDLFALAIPAGEAIGRIACFIGGCCYGKVANGVIWAVYDHGAWRHPTQLYLSLAAVSSFALLLWLERRGSLYDGGLLDIGGMLFCVERFAVELFRAGATSAGPFTLAQWACV